MIQRLDRYVAKAFVMSWLVSLTFFVGFFGVVDFFGDVGDILEAPVKEGARSSMVARFYFLRLPQIYLQVAPFVMLGAALLTVTRLQKHNEFMAMVLTGRRTMRVLAPVLVCTALLVGVQVLVQELAAPAFAHERARLERQLIDHEQDWIIKETNLRDAQNRMIQARMFDVNRGTVGSLLVSYRDERGRPVRLQGKDAVWMEAEGGWRLHQGTLTTVPEEEGAEPTIEPVGFYKTDVRPEDLLVENRSPFDLSYGQILVLAERYPLNRSYRLLRHYHITYPLSILLLVMLGIPYVIKRGSRNTMAGVGFSMGLCMAFMILNATCRDLGIRGIIPWPVIAAWLPVIVAGSLVVVFFDSVEI